MSSHLIDLDEFGIWENDYDLFFEKRCELIARKLRAWVPKRPVDESGARLHDEDYDPDDLTPGDDVDEEG